MQFFKKEIFNFIFLFFILNLSAQEKNNLFKRSILRSGFTIGYASQNTFIRQDSDYFYESFLFKFSNQFIWLNKKKYNLEFLVEPSYYNSKHESFNPWQEFYTSVDNPDYYRDKFMRLKSMNEYVLNLGIIFRYKLHSKFTLFALGNVGPMYIDTDTEMLKKGFAFSDIFALGAHYNIGSYSFDLKTTARHVSNLNLQWPNYGLNSIGFEFGIYKEFKQ